MKKLKLFSFALVFLIIAVVFTINVFATYEETMYITLRYETSLQERITFPGWNSSVDMLWSDVLAEYNQYITENRFQEFMFCSNDDYIYVGHNYDAENMEFDQEFILLNSDGTLVVTADSVLNGETYILHQINVETCAHEFYDLDLEGFCYIQECVWCGYIYSCRHDLILQESAEPDCITDGYEVYECANWGCGFSETIILNKRGHTIVTSDVGYVDKQATCTEYGTRVYEWCKFCDYVNKSSTEPKNPHVFGPVIEQKEPTCSSEGYKIAKCAVCGTDIIKKIEVLEHSYDDFRTCTVCGYNDILKKNMNQSDEDQFNFEEWFSGVEQWFSDVGNDVNSVFVKISNGIKATAIVCGVFAVVVGAYYVLSFINNVNTFKDRWKEHRNNRKNKGNKRK